MKYIIPCFLTEVQIWKFQLFSIIHLVYVIICHHICAIKVVICKVCVNKFLRHTSMVYALPSLSLFRKIVEAERSTANRFKALKSRQKKKKGKYNLTIKMIFKEIIYCEDYVKIFVKTLMREEGKTKIVL